MYVYSVHSGKKVFHTERCSLVRKMTAENVRFAHNCDVKELDDAGVDMITRSHAFEEAHVFHMANGRKIAAATVAAGALLALGIVIGKYFGK